MDGFGLSQRLLDHILGSLFVHDWGWKHSMTRFITASITISLIGAFLIVDLMRAAPNPFAAPSVFSLGSGEAVAGGFCGSLPEKSTE